MQIHFNVNSSNNLYVTISVSTLACIYIDVHIYAHILYVYIYQNNKSIPSSLFQLLVTSIELREVLFHSLARVEIRSCNSILGYNCSKLVMIIKIMNSCNRIE